MSILHLGLMEDSEIDLDIAALELAGLDHPDADLEDQIDTLAAIEQDLAKIADRAKTTAERAGALATILAEDHGFSGDRQHYDDPANADMIAVIDRRLGLPISLSILYVAMARRLGWAAIPLNTPGHVLVRLGNADDTLIVDPFNDGRVVGTEQVNALVLQMSGRPVPLDDILPMSNRSALVRLLLNQATRAEQAGDPARARLVYERITIVAPADAQGWWERARLELVAQDAGAARTSLSAILEITRDEALRAKVADALEALPRPV
jgi:regulator of sirC expression with transglutaminase-like and TPR domain